MAGEDIGAELRLASSEESLKNMRQNESETQKKPGIPEAHEPSKKFQKPECLGIVPHPFRRVKNPAKRDAMKRE